MTALKKICSNPSVVWKLQDVHMHYLISTGVCTRTGEVNDGHFSLVILEFKKVIEENPEIFKDFYDMFDQVPPNPNPEQYSITNYMQLLAVLNRVLTLAPTFSRISSLVCGVPMYGVLAPFCNTEAGYRAFTNPKVNAMFYKIFLEWTRFLVSPVSCDVLVAAEDGWFSPGALRIQDQRVGKPFAEAFVCHPDQPHMGFISWDDFFGRRFREGIRPTIEPDNPEFINAPCEAIPHKLATNVKATDEFWLKDTCYSLNHIFGYDPLASQFVGGTVYQAILSSLDYHRWHSPVDGEVVSTKNIPGTYYAARLDDDPGPDVLSRSQAFVTAMATRAFIVIKCDNPAIGLMCFVAVGLGEVSTCQIDVRVGNKIKKGDELGSFHFGGSTHLLIFRPETKLTLLSGPGKPEEARQVGSLLFHVENSSVRDMNGKLQDRRKLHSVAKSEY